MFGNAWRPASPVGHGVIAADADRDLSFQEFRAVSGSGLRPQPPTLFHAGVVDVIVIPPGDFAALIFDCDGTLADSMPLYHLAWRAALAANGATFDFTWEIFTSRAGVSTEGTVTALNQEFGTTLDATLVERHQVSEYARLVDRVKPFPEVVAIARDHVGKLPMAVASGGSRHLVERTLELIGVRDLFDAVVVAADVPRGKPHPDIFLHAAELLGVAPESCLVFEDGKPGILAAEAAGMRTVFVERSSPYV